MNIEQLLDQINEGFIQRNKHPDLDLYIYNYTAKAQYDRVWNELTLACRGLIMDGNYNIIARPFGKFFNLGEMENQYIPVESFEVYEKMDGSLGILYFVDEKPFIASRGSFTSEQSIKATELLYTKYHDAIGRLDKDHTYLFEIIYPANRIVLDYGDAEMLVLLGIVETATGIDLALVDIGFPVVKRYDGIQDIHALKDLEETNKEGFVIKYRSGLRYKVKFTEYLRIHRIVTQVSTINIWEFLKEGMSFDEVLDRVPDEFYEWVKKTKNDLLERYREIENQCKLDFKILETRKETAIYFQTCAYPNVLFSMLDHKSYHAEIWKMLRPTFQKPFINTEE
jgi:T4 RnlA family RNA ligase